MFFNPQFQEIIPGGVGTLSNQNALGSTYVLLGEGDPNAALACWDVSQTNAPVSLPLSREEGQDGFHEWRFE
jgi:hypothetical protein